MLDSLYIHIPFCTEKCDYCAFYSLPNSDRQPEYLQRLKEEMQTKRDTCGPLRSIFVGGGTPNSLSPEHLQQFLSLIRANFELADDCEFSMEANPASSTSEKLDLMTEYGVNRISFGIQSFSPKIRKAIGRTGNINAVYALLEEARKRKIGNFSCDLIYGVPGQTPEEWQYDLDQLMAFSPPHVSTYSLMIEQGSRLARQGESEGEEELFLEMWEVTEQTFRKQNLQRYEISNFASPGHQCRHNSEIWYGARFMGLGPAAHWFEGDTRWSNPGSLTAWLSGATPSADELPAKERATEILAIGLRTVAGWERAQFLAATGFDFLDLRGPEIRQLAEDGLLVLANTQLRPTLRGLHLNNYLASELL
ncbi:hypothetical protein BVY04_05185 [bacterium M21]|nr:hypothetical protein BVY04_05185 [bacterium M21]